MKNFANLSRKERNAYINAFSARQYKYRDGDAEIQFIKENNTVEEIAYWLKHEATTTCYPGTPAGWFTSVYIFNRLYEFCTEEGAI